MTDRASHHPDPDRDPLNPDASSEASETGRHKAGHPIADDLRASVEDLILRALDDELDADERVELDRVLGTSPEARQMKVQHEALGSLTASWSRHLPDFDVDTVAERIALAEGRPDDSLRTRRLIFRIGAPLAAAAAIAMAVYLGSSPASTEPFVNVALVRPDAESPAVSAAPLVRVAYARVETTQIRVNEEVPSAPRLVLTMVSEPPAPAGVAGLFQG